MQNGSRKRKKGRKIGKKKEEQRKEGRKKGMKGEREKGRKGSFHWIVRCDSNRHTNKTLCPKSSIPLPM